MDIRCNACGRKLAEGEYVVLKIKCQRCKAHNTFTAHRIELPIGHSGSSVPPLERPERPIKGSTHDVH